ncbi:regulatory protein RecX isoform X2 [Salvia hispanica]|uniref:regulatory protein RecX isoform X2 n=1 Tax=Salvia hispanica TaxID=49212 RepID=UPI002009130A|nr:regulatory protein RecX isoform X2 [Salvia hispanica]
MTYFCLNFFHGTANKIQFSHSLVPWLRRNIGCAQGRGYSSSPPLLRYITGKALNKEQNGTTSLPPRASAEGLEFHNQPNRNRSLPSDVYSGFNLEIEGDFTAVADEFIQDPEDSSRRYCGMQDAQNSAIKLLASRAFTSMELKKKLEGMKFHHETIDAVITDFQSRGLINDYLYAETYTRSRWSSSSWGPRRIRQELFKKGISEADAEKAIKLVFVNSEGDEDEDSGIAMSKSSIDQLYAQASKQWQRSQGALQETRKSRIVRWLQYRGFNWSVIKYVLKKLESGGPS